ncbi:Phospholipase D zeta 1 [Ancistrocladus abbreviatus]
MSAEQLLLTGSDRCYNTFPASAKTMSCRRRSEMATCPIFEDLPKATIVSVSRHDATDITPLLLSYTIEVQYRQFKWCLQKKASQVIYLHLALKKRTLIEEFQEKQEQVKEWLQNIGIGDHTAVMHSRDHDSDDNAVHFNQEGSSKHRYVPSRAALSIIRPAFRGQQTVTDKAKVAMQGYLNHFLDNLDIVNSQEVCEFLEVSKLSFLEDYGPKLKEDYLWVKHLPKALTKDTDMQCFSCQWFNCCNNNWRKAWAVLKPGFLAFLEDPFDTKLLDIIIFDILPASNKTSGEKVHLADEIKERNPLRYSFKVSCGNRTIRLRTISSNKVREWVSAINDSVQRPPEGWCHPHRFGSFAPPRGLTEDGSEVQWFIDGQAAFEAIASSIENAESEIFITGWWLCPELYMSRPFRDHTSSRLDALLEARAREGVQPDAIVLTLPLGSRKNDLHPTVYTCYKIYVLLYKEVALALKINSSYTKRRLLSIHENVKVLRYPDHFAARIYYWSHHEKIVIVDYKICFIGGLDLCFGRYDTAEHKVGDFLSSVWPGKDYYNPRESEPNSWEDMMKDELDRGRYPRMPWHDVHCALWGPPCRDVARHFVQRWNYAKRSKAPNQEAIPLLMPHHHMVIPHYMRRSQAIEISAHKVEMQQNLNRPDSFSSESPCQDIPLLLPQDCYGVDVPFIDDEFDRHREHHLEHPIKVSGSLFTFQNSKVEPILQGMQMKGFVNDAECTKLQSKETSYQMADLCTENSMDWWEDQERGYQEVSVNETSQVGPRTSCHCQVIRSVSQWSAGTGQAEESIHRAYCSLIEKAEHFVYIENQFFISGLKGDITIQNRVLDALYKRILRAHKEQKCFRVIVVIPLLPGFQGGLDDGGAATVRALMHWQYRTICRGENSILHNLNAALGPKTHEYISFYGLRTYGRLFDGGPIVTSQVYVHSKVMIIDDRIAFIGSANINDRSLLGSRDSEIGVVIEDKEFVESSINGRPWRAGKFTRSLRVSLWSEHLGLKGEEISAIHDPVADKTYKDLWEETAKANTMIYQHVFASVPNDHIHSRVAFRQTMSQLREKIGYTTIDLGVAPQLLESDIDGKVKMISPSERLQSVRGFVVCFPLEFMRDEDLRPMFHEGEFYTSPEVFH